MALHVYRDSVDAKGNRAAMTKVASVNTWKETHPFRTLTKESRKGALSYVYDDRGNFLCKP